MILRALKDKLQGEQVILYTPSGLGDETWHEVIKLVDGIITCGMTTDAAVIARGYWIPCVAVNRKEVKINKAETWCVIDKVKIKETS